jgi:hypothetical protein
MSIYGLGREGMGALNQKGWESVLNEKGQIVDKTILLFLLFFYHLIRTSSPGCTNLWMIPAEWTYFMPRMI